MLPTIESYESVRLRALVALADLIEGRVGVIESALKLNGMRRRLSGDRLDDDWRIFAVIDSDVDDLPLGRARAYWQPEALAQKDKEREERESFYREQALVSARALLRRYEKGA